MDTKIIFFDIDGTLIDMKKKQITERMLDTLRRLRERGILLAIATGRAPVALPHFEGIEFDVLLTFNGSYCFAGEETIYSNCLRPEDIETIRRNAAAMNRPIAVATKNRMAASGTEPDLEEYYGFARLKLEVAEDFDQVAQEDVYQILAACRKEDYARMMKDVKGAKITSWWDRAVDIIPSAGGKGRGIAKVLEYYHLDRSQAMAFGDGNNDIEMLEAVGTGVAMANGSDDLKAVADEICGDVTEDGIYHYCLQKGLI
mgnify:CR=1 FL=1